MIYIRVTNFCWFAWDFLSLHIIIWVLETTKFWIKANEWSLVTTVSLSFTAQIQCAPVYSSSNVPYVQKKSSTRRHRAETNEDDKQSSRNELYFIQ